jgi:hypothetical protein
VRPDREPRAPELRSLAIEPELDEDAAFHGVWMAEPVDRQLARFPGLRGLLFRRLSPKGEGSNEQIVPHAPPKGRSWSWRRSQPGPRVREGRGEDRFLARETVGAEAAAARVLSRPRQTLANQRPLRNPFHPPRRRGDKRWWRGFVRQRRRPSHRVVLAGKQCGLLTRPSTAARRSWHELPLPSLTRLSPFRERRLPDPGRSAGRCFPSLAWARATGEASMPSDLPRR